jgi:hypothetical protein
MRLCPRYIIIQHLLASLRQRGGGNFWMGNLCGFNQNAQRPKARGNPGKTRVY